MKVAGIFVMLIFIIAPNCYAESSGTNDINALTKACLKSNRMDARACKCMAQKADEKLTSVGFAYVVASLSLDNAKSAETWNKLNDDERMKVSLFMVDGPMECMKALGGN